MSLDEVRTKIKTFRPRTKTLPSISQLKILSPFTVEVDGKPLPLTRDAIKGLCDIIEMPPRFFSRLYQKKKDAWERLVKTMQDVRKPATLIAAEHNAGTGVIAIVEHMGDITKHSEVVDTAALVLRNKNFQLRSVDFSGIELRMHIMSKAEIDVGEWSESKDDTTFRQGILLQNSIVHGFKATSAFEQMICTNLQYCELPNTATSIDDLEKVPDFLFHRAFKEIGSWLKRRIGNLRKTNMSLAEIIDVARFFQSDIKEGRIFLKEYHSQLRLAEIGNAYRMNSEEMANQPDMWKATVKTPFICYDIMSWLSYMARHDKRLNTYEVMKLRIKSGQILTEIPHLASIAEQKVISKSPWILSTT